MALPEVRLSLAPQNILVFFILLAVGIASGVFLQSQQLPLDSRLSVLLSTSTLFFWGSVVMAFGISLGLTRLSIFFNIHDVPVERSSHSHPTPKSGGVGVVALFIGIALVASFSQSVLLFNRPTFWASFISGISLMVILGFWDDWKSLPALIRGIGQIIAGCLIINTGLTFHSITLPFIGTIAFGNWSPLITLFWIVFFINVFNFMDGLNGLAAGVSCVVCLFVILLTPYHMGVTVSYCCLFLFISLSSFLLFNFPTASVFMGDVGSQSIGLIFSILGIMISYRRPDLFSTVNFLILFLPFLLDVGIVLSYRLCQKKNIFKAHREYLFQRLTLLNISHTHVTLGYMAASALYGLALLICCALHINEFYLLFFGGLLQSGWAFWLIRKTNPLLKIKRYTSNPSRTYPLSEKEVHRKKQLSPEKNL